MINGISTDKTSVICGNLKRSRIHVPRFFVSLGKSNDGSKFDGLLVRLDFASEPSSVVRCSLEYPGSNFTVTDASPSFNVTLTNRSASRPG